MFTGIIETTGRLVKRKISGKSGEIFISAAKPFANLKAGESIAVNGTCLTLKPQSSIEIMEFDVLAETFKRTNLGSLPLNSNVHLERAMKLGDRVGGHLISGHVDAVSPVKKMTKKGKDWELQIHLPEELKAFLVEKGSIAIDGVSLTIVDIRDDYFSVHLIPTTMQETCLGEKKTGDLINIETDMIGKFVQKQAVQVKSSTKITMDSLKNAGW